MATPVGVVLLTMINKILDLRLGPTMLDIVVGGEKAALSQALTDSEVLASAVPLEEITFAPIYRDPPKLWGVGLNYMRHADDLEVRQPTEAPGSYLRPASCIIGHGDEILLPRHQSRRVTAEAELGVVVGQTCRDVAPEAAASVIFGFTTVQDMTAEDAIRINPRYIPWSKAFDTFCALGPWVVTPEDMPPLPDLTISTVINGETVATNQVSAMAFDPYWQICHFSGGMVLEAGSVIATGTPGAGVIEDGDVVEAFVENVGTLRTTVRAVG